MPSGPDPGAGVAGTDQPGWPGAPGSPLDVQAGGYEPFESSPFIDLVGSMWVRRGDGAPWLRFGVEPRHANRSGLAHGGVLMTLVDVVLAQGIRALVGEPLRLATVGLTVDFVRPVAVGAWVDGRAEVQRGSGRMVFANCFLMSNGDLVVRASGTYVVSTGRDGTDPLAEPSGRGGQL
jgi:acyl-coenzyme A thioesterase 13